MDAKELKKILEEKEKELKLLLESKIKKCERVVIVPHNNTDLDAIASAIGISLIAKKYGKDYIIIENDPAYLIESGVKAIMNECQDSFNFSKKDKYLKTYNPDDLFILTDVNKTNLICVSELLTNPDNVIVIDHHDCGDDTVKSNHIFIDTNFSSASEIITMLLQLMRIDIPVDVANYLYAGISLDTNRLTKNTQPNTMNMASYLLECGVDMNRINQLFKEDIQEDRIVRSLINNVRITGCLIAIIKASEEDEYTREQLAKAADYALKYGVDASFAIGKVDNAISISGRAIDKVNVGLIMEQLGKEIPNAKGGGSPSSGACRIPNLDIEEVNKYLVKLLTPNYFRD